MRKGSKNDLVNFLDEFGLSANQRNIDSKYDIRTYTNKTMDHKEFQKMMPDGYDAVWVLATKIDISAMGSFGEGFTFSAGSVQASFINCNTKDSFSAIFSASLTNNDVSGVILGGGINITQYGGMGMVPSGSSPTEIASSFAQAQGTENSASILFIGGSHSESNKWVVNSVNASVDIPVKTIFGKNFGIDASIISTKDRVELDPESIKSLGKSTW